MANVFVILLFIPQKMALIVGGKNTSEEYVVFLKSFHPRVERLLQRLERINDKIGRSDVCVWFND